MSKQCPVSKLMCWHPPCENYCHMERAAEQPAPKTPDEMLAAFRSQPYHYSSGPQPIILRLHLDGLIPLVESILQIHQKLDKTMATIEEVQQAVADLQATVDTTQAAIAAAIKALEDQIAAGSAATPEQLQAVIDSLKAVQSDVASTPTA